MKLVHLHVHLFGAALMSWLPGAQPLRRRVGCSSCPVLHGQPRLHAGTWLGRHLRGYAHWRRRRRSRYRSTPGAGAQFGLLFRRAGVKWVRNWGYKFVDLLLFVFAALVVGVPQPGLRTASWATPAASLALPWPLTARMLHFVNTCWEPVQLCTRRASHGTL